MALKKWDSLPERMRTPEVKPYYDSLSRRRAGLALKRIFDLVMSVLLIIILSPAMLVIAVAVALDSPGGVFYRQRRVTTYGKEFRIFTFRTMRRSRRYLRRGCTHNPCRQGAARLPS